MACYLKAVFDLASCCQYKPAFRDFSFCSGLPVPPYRRADPADSQERPTLERTREENVSTK